MLLSEKNDEVKMHVEIDNVTHPLMELTRELLTPEGRIQHNKFIIDDPENIIEALNADIQISQIFFYGDHAQRHSDLLNNLPKSVECFPIRPRTCKKVFGVEKQARVFAIADIPNPQPLSSLSSLEGDVVALDGVMMTGNIGAIIRSSLAFNMGSMVILNLEPHALYDRRLIRASRGLLFRLPILCAPSTDFFKYCKENEIKVLNCTHKASDEINDVVPCSNRLAIVLGAEKKGVSDETETFADFSAKIPMNEGVESLNVSVAASIIFYSRFNYLRKPEEKIKINIL